MNTLETTGARAPRIGLALALFLPRTEECTEALVSELEAYCSHSGPALQWWSDDDDESWRPVTPELLAYPRRRLLGVRRRKQGDYCAHAHGGADPGDPHPTFASLSIGAPDLDQAFGLLRMWKDDAIDSTTLLEMTRSASTRLQPIQGYAGLAVAPYADRLVSQVSRELQFAIAMRHEGLEVQSSWFTKNVKLDSLWAVQWLTIVSDTLLSPLGGRAALADLPDGVVIHDYGSGVVIQAGAAPDPGDVNKPDTLGLYRAVAKKLAPIRIRNPLPLNVEAPRSLSREETRKWYRRLERDR